MAATETEVGGDGWSLLWEVFGVGRWVNGGGGDGGDGSGGDGSGGGGGG